MSGSARRTTPCTREILEGRRRKARGFQAQAETVRDLADPDDDIGDVVVSLYVLAGIAASDVLCCRSLGEHARGDDHQEAVRLLGQVEPHGSALANQLHRLLGLKTKAAYARTAVGADDVRLAERAATRLVDAAMRAGLG